MEGNMRDCRLKGYALAVAKTTKGWGHKVISVEIQCPATYTPDWQEDGGFMHDEGQYEYEINEAEPIDNTIYKVALLGGDFVQGEGKIEKIIQFLDWDIEEGW
jgi:hypothetical protein